MTDKPYLVISRRYRPRTFADVVGQEAIVTTLKNAIRSGKLSSAYLFSGSRGTGKTTLARLFAKALNCASLLPSGEPCNACTSCKEIAESCSLDVQEIDGASYRGIDHVRTLTEGAAYAPTSGKYKIYIIDEVHMLTKEAFNALLKVLEEPPPFVKFFFATTEPHKIPGTIISRCQRFGLYRLTTDLIVSKLCKVASELGFSADDGALVRLASYSEGSLRDAESLLDQIATFSDGHITIQTIEEVLGLTPTTWLIELDLAIETADISVAYRISDKVFYEGKDIGHFVDDVCEHYRAFLFTHLNTQMSLDERRKEHFQKMSQKISQEHLLEILGLLAEAQRSLKSASSPRFLLEWLLISIVRVKCKVPVPLIVKKLSELQKSIVSAPQVSPQPPTTQAPPVAPQTTKPPAQPQKKASRPLPTPTAILPTEQEECRQHNVLQFAAVELGATLIKNTTTNAQG
jgi:DNA polymerase-3 subunit gamma/tau